MQLNDITSRLSGVKRNANGSYQAKCPCHDDKTASLTVSDENGIPVHKTIRYEPKKFVQCALNPNGSVKEWTLKNTRTVLYNLPAVTAAETVYLTEGEKDADNLIKLGFAATTSPMGAAGSPGGRKWKQDYTETLRGKDVIVIPDNDAAGQKHAATVNHALRGIAKSVKVAHLAGVPNKGDVSDYLARAKSDEEARNLILTLPLAENLNILNNNQDIQENQESVKLSDFSDIAVADAFSKEYGGIIRYTPSLKWLVWNGAKWENSDLKAQGWEMFFTDRLHRDALKSGDGDYIKFAVKMRSFNRVQGVLGIARSFLEIIVDELDSNPFDLNTPAGIVDLRTGATRPHDPGAFCTKTTAVSPSAERSALFDKFLYEITCGNAELARYIQCVAGMTALGKVYSEVLIIAHGGGHNGKSTLFNTLYEILGDYSGKIPAECLTTKAKNPKNDMAELFGKRLVIASETEEGNRLSTAMLKQIASTDPLTAEKKFRDPFVFIPTHSLILYTNYLPKIGSDDLGTWRRLVPVPFNAKIEKPELDLAERLLNEAGGAILSWMIAGAKMFIENKYRLPVCNAVETAKTQYKADNDWLTLFLDECCDVAPQQAEFGSKLYAAYSEWCAKTGEYRRCNRDFSHALEARGFVRKKGSRCNSWHGVCVCRDWQT